MLAANHSLLKHRAAEELEALLPLTCHGLRRG